MGYPNVAAAAAIQLGFPAVSQAMYLVEHAMENLLPESVAMVTNIVGVLQKIEAQEVESLSRLKAQQVGEMKLRNGNDEATEGSLLRSEREAWVNKLATILGAPVNPHGRGSASGLVRIIREGES